MIAPGGGPDAVGRGVEWSLESRWPLDPLWVVVLGGAAVAALGWLYLRRGTADSVGDMSMRPRRRWTLMLVRTAVVILLLWMIGGWRVQRYETDLPDLALLVDASRSMTLPSGDSASDAGRSRWRSAVELLSAEDAALLDQLAREYRLRAAIVGEERTELSPVVDQLANQLVELAPEQDSSRLGDAVADAVAAQRGRSTAAIVMITDGVVTAGIPLDQAARAAAAERLPLIFIRTGSTEPPPQVVLAELISEPTAMVGDRVRVMARVRWTDAGGFPVRVRLVDQATGRELAAATVRTATASGSETVPLSFLATEPGLRRLSVEAEPVPGEVATEDNRAEGTVEVRDESFRVLLVQGGPSFEFRFLKHLLERATSRDGSRQLVDLTTVLQRGDAQYADQDRTAQALPPIDAETLEQLDLIILSDCDPEDLGNLLLTRIAGLVQQHGTSLVVISGPDHLPQAFEGTPLERLMPLDPGSVRNPVAASEPLQWRRTPLGQSVPSLWIQDDGAGWRTAPPLYWLARVDALRPGARVLLETAGHRAAGGAMPIVISQMVGSGQVWLHLTDETFRLRAAEMDAQRYERYWLQLIRSLARRSHAVAAGEAELEVLGERFPASRPVPFRARLGSSLASAAGGEVEIAVSNSTGVVGAFRAAAEAGGGGAYRGVMDGLEPGSYRAVLIRPVGEGDPPSDTFVVEQDRLEMMRTTADVEAMETAAAITGGRVIAIEEAPAELLDSIPPGRDIRLRSLPPVPIWNHWAIAAALFLALSSEWILRRRWGGL